MKKQLLLSSLILLLVASFTACKKENFESKSMRDKIIGKWQVNKIEFTTGTEPTVSISYAVSDYMDFKNNVNDDVELGLGENRSVGRFSTGVDNSLYIDFSSKDVDCLVSTITENKLTFTGTVVGSNPKKTETYYLSR